MIGRTVIGGVLALGSALLFAVPSVTVTYLPATPRRGDTVTFNVVARSTTGAKQARPHLSYKFDAAWQSLGSPTIGTVRALVTGVDSGRMIATWARSDGNDVADTVWVRFASPLPPPVVAGVSLTPLSVYLLPKQTQQFTGLAWAKGAATPIAGAKLRWSLSDSTIGSIDSTGLFTAARAGSAKLVVAGGDPPTVKTETALVTVVPLTGGTKTDTVTVQLPGRVDTVYKTDPLLDTVLTDALLTPYRDSIRALKDSLAKLSAVPIAARAGCPDSLPNAVVLRFADQKAAGPSPRDDIAPLVMCGSSGLALAMQTYVAWESGTPCPCNSGAGPDTTTNPYSKVILAPPDTAKAWQPIDSMRVRADSTHWRVVSGLGIPWKHLGGVLYDVMSDAKVSGVADTDSLPLSQWWSYVPTRDGSVRTQLVVTRPATDGVVGILLVRSSWWNARRLYSDAP